MSYKELLPTRIPESFEGDNNLREYLEVAGELMDEFVAAIDGFKDYKDYQYVPEKRLRDLAADFAMEFPRNLDEKTKREILRDLKEIYSRTGVYEVIKWTFRLIGWEIQLESAWLPNPENYEPQLTDLFNLDDYGREQEYPVEIVDFFRTDFRSFLIGEEYLTDHGVYFRGREFFDTEQTIDKLEIIGEYYETETKFRTADKVAKTPYVFVRISDETYNKYLLPYIDPETGEVFTYSNLEVFRVVENILNFFVFEEYRPTHVRVVIIVNTQEIFDRTIVSEYFESEYIPKPLEMEDDIVVTMDDFSRLDHIMRSGNFFMAGVPPSPFGRKMVLAPLKNTKLITAEQTDPHTRYSTMAEDTGYIVSKPLEEQPAPYCNTSEFTFYTPDGEEAGFRRVYFNRDAFLSAHYETGTGGSVDGTPWVDDLDSIALSFDLVNERYGIVEALAAESIIIREPTDVTSPHFKPVTPPVDEYEVAIPDGSGGFQPNTLIEFDFTTESYEMDEDPKTFTYYYDFAVFTKAAVQEITWVESFTNIVEGDLVGLVDFNEILFVPSEELGFDFTIDVKYGVQPEWENDPRNE